MGRYHHVKAKKSRPGTLIFITVALLLTGALGWLLNKYSSRPAATVENVNLPLPQIPASPEPKPDNSLLDIEPIPAEPIVEVLITPNSSVTGLPAGAPATWGTGQPSAAPETIQYDALFKAELVKLSPKLAKWLSTEELIKKYLLLINDIAEETRIAKHVQFLAPKQPFQVQQQAGKMFISVQSYQRYDALAAAIDALDVDKTIAIYKKFRPVLAKSFAQISHPEVQSMEDVFAKAAAEMLVVPIIEEPIEVVRPSVSYKFADPKLEALNPVHKQMLRMGPKNTRLIQNKIRLLIEALVNLKE